ncbi:hypothetical protein SAMN04488548_1344187 [Gordonia westfalica]|uniref:Uncharacterized protein n=1 Tax=Gordonia westfalica TaxID=158898 RepID=A0A1H2L1W6_9ACTN|nr:hypothetical protein SAMN04488548_1344187 [Gordonia westfalica]
MVGLQASVSCPPYPGQPPAGQYPQGPWGPPPPKKSHKGLWITLGVLAFLVVGAVIAGGVALVGNSDGAIVYNADDVDVGQCLEVTSGSDSLKAEKISCDTTDFHYVVAGKSFTRFGCGLGYSTFWFAGNEKEVLCLAQAGKCYHLPESSGADTTSLAQAREIDCGQPVPAGEATNFKVETKESREPDCPEGQGEYYVAQPKPTGYCVSLLE